MIRSDDLDRSVAQPLPDCLVIFFLAQWRRHHVFDSFFWTAIAEFIFCQEQVLGTRFDIDILLPFPACQPYLIQTFMSGKVDHIDWRIPIGAGHGKKHVDTFCFGNIGPRQGLPDRQQFIRF